jgi:hypothetical protein
MINEISFYQSAINPNVICNNMDDAKKLFETDPTNPDFKVWIMVKSFEIVE